MKEYMMDSNAPPQSRGTPYSACHFVSPQAREKSATAEPDCNRFLSAFGMTATWKFSFARGKPVVANRQPGVSLIVIRRKDDEESASLKEISLFVRNDKKERPVRDRRLFMFRDDPPVDYRQVSCHIHQSALKTMLSGMAIVCRQRE